MSGIINLSYTCYAYSQAVQQEAVLPILTTGWLLNRSTCNIWRAAFISLYDPLIML